MGVAAAIRDGVQNAPAARCAGPLTACTTAPPCPGTAGTVPAAAPGAVIATASAAAAATAQRPRVARIAISDSP